MKERTECRRRKSNSEGIKGRKSDRNEESSLNEGSYVRRMKAKDEWRKGRRKAKEIIMKLRWIRRW